MSDQGLHDMAEDLREIIANAETAAELSSSDKSVKGATANAIDESVEQDVVPLSKELAPSDSGRLTESIEGESLGWKGPEYIVSVGSDVDYAAVQEHGTRKKNYPIVPTNAERLSFYWEKKGAYVQRQAVTHPGIEGKHFLRDGVMETQKARRARVLSHLGEAFKGAYGGKD